MNRTPRRIPAAFALSLALALAGGPAAADDLTGMDRSAYYKVHPLFHPFPDESRPLQSIGRFGPVGIGIDLLQPAFRMRVRNVEEGSPAAATGKLRQGQLIDSINGRTLEERDPRQILGDLVAAAEATDGVVKLLVRDTDQSPAEEVVVRIPVLGTYGRSWPLDCPKSDRIVRGMAAFVARNGPGNMGLGTLFLLSTGEERDLDVVRGWMRERTARDRNVKESATYPWYAGYGGPALCEYFLRTGDASILHSIQLMVDALRRTQYNDAWGHKGVGDFGYMAGGHMNAAGVHAVTFLLLAKQCGADVDERLLQTALRHFYRFAGRGAVAYGDGLPEATFVDNGRNGGLAFALAAAAALTPGGEASVYAKARDMAAMTSFYSTSWMLHGHTGGGIGEIWRGAAMGLLVREKPSKYRAFMDNRAWFYDLSRRHDGSFGIVGGERYDDPSDWGIGLALAYTVPRRTLCIAGAPASRHGRSHPLPVRPWGTAADDVFYSLAAAPVRGGPPQDVDAEALAEDGSWPVLRRLRAAGVSDETLLRYAHHPEIGIRRYAAGQIKALSRSDLAIELLRSKDPRVRDMGIDTAPVNDETVGLLLGMVEDPEESWWVAANAMTRLGAAPPDRLAPHLERLLYWLGHEEWWLSRAAMTALTGLAADRRHCRAILPVVGAQLARNTRAAALSPLSGIVARLASAAPEVQALALETLGEAYTTFPRSVTTAGGEAIPSGEKVLLGSLARHVTQLPGGYDALYRRAHARYPDLSLPHRELFLAADAANGSDALREGVRLTIERDLIPEFVGAANHIASNRRLLREEADSSVAFKPNFYYARPRMEDLVELYNRMGVHDYDWHDFGPALRDMRWDYFTFDPADGRLPGTGTRYRPVTVPPGMEEWFAADFDARGAGWRSGLQPFGQANGKLVTEAAGCRFDFCRCGEPMQTLWDREVLLVRGTFAFPPFREGHRYRLLVGGMSHVNAGEGFRVYVNGKRMFERDRGVGKREGAKPICFWIDKAWWPDFQGGRTTIAATSFLRVEPQARGNRFFVWLQEMKVPPLGEPEILQSVKAVPMLSSAWQALQDPERPEYDEAEGKFRWDGRFVENPALRGSWEQVGEVASAGDFKPGVRLQASGRLPRTLVFREAGRTDHARLYYSGNLLLHLDRNEALEITSRTFGGVDYLFVEGGGFGVKNGPRWKPPLVVLQRK